MIGYGLEIGEGPPHPDNTVRLTGNTFYSDRPQGGRLLNAAHTRNIEIKNNVAVGPRKLLEPGEGIIKDRDSARPSSYPALPGPALNSR